MHNSNYSVLYSFEFPLNSKQNLADEWLRINHARPVTQFRIDLGPRWVKRLGYSKSSFCWCSVWMDFFFFNLNFGIIIIVVSWSQSVSVSVSSVWIVLSSFDTVYLSQKCFNVTSTATNPYMLLLRGMSLDGPMVTMFISLPWHRVVSFLHKAWTIVSA